jgi:putative hemolysin
MELVEKSEIAGLVNWKGNSNILAVKLLMNALKINELNNIYSKLSDQEASLFLKEALALLKINYECAEDDFLNIPKKGGFITISNHPYGGIDGVLLLHLLLMQRKDYKIIGNFLLQRIKPIESLVFPVNPFELYPEYASSISGIRQAYKYIRNGHGLGIFPAGEVSSYNKIYHKISDRKWNNSILKFIKKAEVPVIPIYFAGTNSKIFHAMGLLHPSLRTAGLPSELFNKKDKNIRIKIGKPITVEEQKKFSDIEKYGRYLRARTYLPEASEQVKKYFAQPSFRIKNAQPLIDSVNKKTLKKEIDNLSYSYKLFTSGHITVYCSPSKHIPFCMQEIGRLREKTFREVGEGTNKKIDIDEYDLYYRQLFLWDNVNQCIAGAYRIGIGKEIMQEYDVKGFYTHSLFKYKKEFYHFLSEGLELGRSFICKEYQKKPLSLFLLWKGILFFLLNNPDYRYLIGPVSISNQYSQISRRLIMDFILANYSEKFLSEFVKPRKKFKVHQKQIDTKILIEKMNGNISLLEKALRDIDPVNSPIPVLLKKYLKINGKILGFNLDPKFNNALDGLLLLDLYDIPENIISSLSKECKGNNLIV